ncbi:MAG: hypothetical protein A2Z96_04070 [Spirochaetes bacterium GWB1_48_6]|nr:MAG: hypothetical protein A2Z96_04070 [Spirochaetes bacterium GWB1_48_6]
MELLRIGLFFGDSEIPPGKNEYEKGNPGIHFQIIQNLRDGNGFDLLLFPAVFLDEYLSLGPHPGLFFCSGSLHQLRHSLLLGAGDFLKIPWDWSEVHLRWDLWRSRNENRRLDFSVPGLSWTESKILQTLISHAPGFVTRSELANCIKKSGKGSRSLDVHIHSLRKKLNLHLSIQGKGPLKTLRGLGYALDFLAPGSSP